MEGRHDPYAISQTRLRHLRRRAQRGKLDQRDLGRHQRNDGVDHNFPGDGILDLIQNRIVAGKRYGEHHDVAATGRSLIGVAADRRGAVPGFDFAGRSLGLIARARADHHRVTRGSPAHRQAGPERARATDDSKGSAILHQDDFPVRIAWPQPSFISVRRTISTPAASRASRAARAVATPVGSSP
ncbi:hypothetical protein D3C83_09530 [compost metagenome]